jgi:hypothetical protein
MYQATSTVGNQCIAHITTNRNRSKIYGNSIYLKDGQNFEIELFNPTQSRVLAKINLNGKAISTSGIILRPGERVYLERFIDTNNKFVFETYEVEKSKETLNAIENNGMIEVYFYQEYIPTSTYIYAGTTVNTPTFSSPSIFTTPSYPYNNIYCMGSIGVSGSLGPQGLNGSTTSDARLYSSLDSTFNSKSLNEGIETGRVERGDSSNQSFDQSSGEFNSFHSNVVSYKLSPESQRPVEISTLRNYCTSCGTRVKKTNWKFCPNCGEKY